MISNVTVHIHIFPFIFALPENSLKQTEACWSVVSCADPVVNVSWMSFQEGQITNLSFRKGVVQAAHIRNNPYVKCTGVY
jgi:hypothetical protein